MSQTTANPKPSNQRRNLGKEKSESMHGRKAEEIDRQVERATDLKQARRERQELKRTTRDQFRKLRQTA